MAEKNRSGYVVPHNPNQNNNRSQRNDGTFSYQPNPETTKSPSTVKTKFKSK